jgi:hypothetical protein
MLSARRRRAELCHAEVTSACPHVRNVDVNVNVVVVAISRGLQCLRVRKHDSDYVCDYVYVYVHDEQGTDLRT